MNQSLDEKELALKQLQKQFDILKQDNDLRSTNANGKIMEMTEQLMEKDKKNLAVVSALKSENQELQSRINQDQQVLKDQLEKLYSLTNDLAVKDSELIEVKDLLLKKDGDLVLEASKLQFMNEELQKLLDQEQNNTNAIQEKDTNIAELKEKLKSKDNEVVACNTLIDQLNHTKLKLESEIKKIEISSQVTEKSHKEELRILKEEQKAQKSADLESVGIQTPYIASTQTNDQSLLNDNQDLKCQLKLSQKEMDKLYQRITEQEIQIRSLKISDPKNKDLEEQLENLSTRYMMLEKTAEQTNSLNDDLNEKYLNLIKKSKNLENLVKKLHRQLEQKQKEMPGKENNQSPDKPKTLQYSNTLNEQNSTGNIPSKSSPAVKPSILKRRSTELEKTSESSSILKESRSTVAKQKLGPAARVLAADSRKSRKIDSSREGRQECNQQ